MTQVQLTDTGVRCTLNNTGGEYSQDVERVLLAVGVQPNIEDLGLETLGVELDRGFIKTDAACRTNVFGLYAIGDVAGRRVWRTRPATKACSALRPWPVSKAPTLSIATMCLVALMPGPRLPVWA